MLLAAAGAGPFSPLASWARSPRPTFAPGPGEGTADPDALGLRHGWLALPRLRVHLGGFAAALQRRDVLGQPLVEPGTRPLPNLWETQPTP